MAGSVYQRAGDGRWVASLYVDGRKIVRYRGTKKEAEQALESLNRENTLGTVVVPTQTTLAEWLEIWIQSRERRPSTQALYQRVVRAWCTEIGHLRLHKLTPERLQRVLTRWKQAETGSRTLQQRYQYLHGALNQAVRVGLLPKNPLDQMLRPQVRTQRRERWTVSEVRSFLETCQGSTRKQSGLLLFLLLTGMRVSEALALTWRDIDSPAGPRARISKALVWSNGAWTIQPPKSEAGYRSIELHPLAYSAVIHNNNEHERIFVTETGSPPRKDNLSRLMKSLCADGGVPRIRVHDLRSVHAMLLVAGGLDVKSLQSVLGHSRVSMSLDVYAYASANGGQVTRALGSVIGSKVERT